jgi:hypothetical protein
MNDIRGVDLGIETLMFIDEIDDGRGFACTRRSIKEQIRKIILVQNIFENGAIDGFENNFFESCRTVFLYPWNIGSFSTFCHFFIGLISFISFGSQNLF